MSKNILIAIRTCGEIDADGGPQDYGDEEGPGGSTQAYDVVSGGSEDLNFEVLNYSLADSLEDN